MSAPNGCLVAVIVVFRIAAGAALIAYLGAPSWAVAAWLLFDVEGAPSVPARTAEGRWPVRQLSVLALGPVGADVGLGRTLVERPPVEPLVLDDLARVAVKDARAIHQEPSGGLSIRPRSSREYVRREMPVAVAICRWDKPRFSRHARRFVTVRTLSSLGGSPHRRYANFGASVLAQLSQAAAGSPLMRDHVQADRMPSVAGAIGSGNRGRLRATKVPPTTGPWRRGRCKHPRELRLMYLPGAADFGDDRGLMSVIGVIRAFRTLGRQFERMLAAEFDNQRELHELAQASAPADGEPQAFAKRGRPQKPGRWDLAATAYIASRDPSVESFCHRWSGSGLWRECGFGDWEPDARTARLHFNAMEEERWQAFGTVANALIARAHERDPNVGEFGFGDATKWQSSARIKRVTPDGGPGRKWSTKNMLSRANEADVQDLHEKEGANPEPDVIEWTDEQGQVVVVEGAVAPTRADRKCQYFVFNGVEYMALDRTSGVRKMVKQPGNRVDVWFGGYAFSIVDMYTGLRLSTQTFRADEQEYDHLPAAVEEINETIGGLSVLSVDKFSATRDVYEYCGRRGIYLVAPYKGSVQKPKRQDIRMIEVDEHQIPRCPDCGGPGDVIGPSLGHYWDENEQPRIRARCINRDSDECAAHPIFSEASETEWRLLTGLPLTTQLYHAVRERHQTFESGFNADRRRNSFAGKGRQRALVALGRPGAAAARRDLTDARLVPRLPAQRLDRRLGTAERRHTRRSDGAASRTGRTRQARPRHQPPAARARCTPQARPQQPVRAGRRAPRPDPAAHRAGRRTAARRRCPGRPGLAATASARRTEPGRRTPPARLTSFSPCGPPAAAGFRLSPGSGSVASNENGCRERKCP